MKAKRLGSGVVVFIMLFFIGNSFCSGADITVIQGDEASSPTLAEVQVQTTPVTTQETPVVTYGTVKEKTLLDDDSRTTYDNYEEKKFGKQLDVQVDLKFPSLEDKESVAGNENVITEETGATVSKEERIISLVEMQQELQEEKLILSKPIPLFVGGS